MPPCPTPPTSDTTTNPTLLPLPQESNLHACHVTHKSKHDAARWLPAAHLSNWLDVYCFLLPVRSFHQAAVFMFLLLFLFFFQLFGLLVNSLHLFQLWSFLSPVASVSAARRCSFTKPRYDSHGALLQVQAVYTAPEPPAFPCGLNARTLSVVLSWHLHELDSSFNKTWLFFFFFLSNPRNKTSKNNNRSNSSEKFSSVSA